MKLTSIATPIAAFALGAGIVAINDSPDAVDAQASQERLFRIDQETNQTTRYPVLQDGPCWSTPSERFVYGLESQIDDCIAALDEAPAPTTTEAPTVTITYQPERFETLAPGSSLPSGAECAGLVRSAPETRPGNEPFNQTEATSRNDRFPRVAGNFTGTTDEIIQWGACKWGIDEDLIRAQWVRESYWFADTIGDFTSRGSSCARPYGVGDYPAQYNGDSEHDNQCPESVGLTQVRWDYHQEAFEDSNAVYSTAYNLDYALASWRACFEGEYTWLDDVDGRGDYAAGDAEGCQGVWFAGRWYTQGAQEYIDIVQGHLADRTWEQDYFVNAVSMNDRPAMPPS